MLIGRKISYYNLFIVVKNYKLEIMCFELVEKMNIVYCEIFCSFYRY